MEIQGEFYFIKFGHHADLVTAGLVKFVKGGNLHVNDPGHQPFCLCKIPNADRPSVAFRQCYNIISLQIIIDDMMAYFQIGDFLVPLPVPDLIYCEKKSQGNLDPGMDGLLHIFIKTVPHTETDQEVLFIFGNRNIR